MYFFIFFIILNLIIFYKYELFCKLINIYDLPDKKRRIHKFKIPLTGGIIFFINIIFLFILYNNNFEDLGVFENKSQFYLFIFSCVFIFLIGLLDDKLNISANKKLLLLIFILSFILYFDKDVNISFARLSFMDFKFQFGNFSFLWTIVCFLLFVNAFNMLDGINLQSGFYSFILILVFLYLKLSYLFFIYLLFPTILFLYLNFKNKSFLGNSGSYLLPYIFSYFFIKNYNYNDYLYADLIVLVMIIPGLDLIRLFFLRIIDKRNPFSADNNHLHHILLKRKGYFKTLIIIQSIIILPVILGIYLENSLIALSISFVLYIYFLFKK